MALLKKLFGRGDPAPELPVHPEDQDLVSEDDKRWWRTLTLKDCQVLEQQDNVFKVAALKHYIEEDGLCEEEAARRVRKSFAAYYANLEGRSNEPLGFGGEDAKLPYVLKDRVNRAITGKNRKIDRSEVSLTSSVNALIRRFIREHKINT